MYNFLIVKHFRKISKKFFKFYSIIFKKFLLAQNFRNLYKHKILVSKYEDCIRKSTMSEN